MMLPNKLGKQRQQIKRKFEWNKEKKRKTYKMKEKE